MSKTKEILQKMKDVLNERGWTQASLLKNGKCCLVGSWALATETAEIEDIDLFGESITNDTTIYNKFDDSEESKFLMDCIKDNQDNRFHAFYYSGIINSMSPSEIAWRFNDTAANKEEVIEAIDCALSKAA
jgi:hypothetical protein